MWIQRIKQSSWNKPLIKDPKVDKFLNWIFWLVVVLGIIGLISTIGKYLFFR